MPGSGAWAGEGEAATPSPREGETQMAKEILCAYGIDVNAVAGWIGSYGGADSPDDIFLRQSPALSAGPTALLPAWYT
jgi:hypothetical protein